MVYAGSSPHFLQLTNLQFLQQSVVFLNAAVKDIDIGDTCACVDWYASNSLIAIACLEFYNIFAISVQYKNSNSNSKQ